MIEFHTILKCTFFAKINDKVGINTLSLFEINFTFSLITNKLFREFKKVFQVVFSLLYKYSEPFYYQINQNHHCVANNNKHILLKMFIQQGVLIKSVIHP